MSIHALMMSIDALMAIRVLTCCCSSVYTFTTQTFFFGLYKYLRRIFKTGKCRPKLFLTKTKLKTVSDSSRNHFPSKHISPSRCDEICSVFRQSTNPNVVSTSRQSKERLPLERNKLPRGTSKKPLR